MIINFENQPPRRISTDVGFDDIDITDITSAERSGPSVWIGPFELDMPFTSEPTPEEQDAIKLRFLTSNLNEELVRRKAQDALAGNNIWRTTALPEILSKANAIEGHASATPFDKELARGIRNLANRCDALTQQNSALIRLVLRELGSVD